VCWLQELSDGEADVVLQVVISQGLVGGGKQGGALRGLQTRGLGAAAAAHDSGAGTRKASVRVV